MQSSYGGTEDVVVWLAEAQQAGGLSSERLGNLINEVQHQGGTSTAMYAVATHLIELARRATPEAALTLLTHTGIIYANSDRPGAVSCPAFLQAEFAAWLRMEQKCSYRFFHWPRILTLTSGLSRACRFYGAPQLRTVLGWPGPLRGHSTMRCLMSHFHRRLD